MAVQIGGQGGDDFEKALAHGLQAEAGFDISRDAIHMALMPTVVRSSPLFEAIPSRQCTWGDYDGQPLSGEELSLLEAAGSSRGVRMLLLTERSSLERVLEYVVRANAAQLVAPPFIKEFKSWIRFNGADAARTRDGLFSVSSGNMAIPGWLGDLAFGWFITAKGENDKIARQVRNLSGIAVFVGEAADKAHSVGRASEGSP